MRALALGITATLAWSAPASAEPSSCGKEAILAFADQFDQAQLRKDAVALDRMVADDLVFITSSGERKGKAEFIAGWTGPDESYDPITLVDRVVVLLGPSGGVVSAETTLSGRSGGKTFSTRIRFSDTFRCVRGEMRAAHIQVTRIPN
jgi:ketosteroid isomerase-like protein